MSLGDGDFAVGVIGAAEDTLGIDSVVGAALCGEIGATVVTQERVMPGVEGGTGPAGDVAPRDAAAVTSLAHDARC